MPRLPLAFVVFVATLAGGAEPRPLPFALRGVDPRHLSGGLDALLAAEGRFPGQPAPPPGADTLPAVAPLKGTPPAVLDPRVTANVRLGEDPTALAPDSRQQAEPHVARSRSDPDLLLATFQEGRRVDAGAAAIGYAVSEDGGRTWRRALVPRLTQLTGGPYFRATDPVAGIDADGTLYLNALAARDATFDLADVVVLRSTDRGATWSDPLVVFRAPNVRLFPDKNWMAVDDLPGSPRRNRLAVTYTAFTSDAAGRETGNNLYCHVSDDRGQTWQGPFEITPPGARNQSTVPVFLPDGSLLVPFITFTNETNAFRIECKRSADGGRTWPGGITLVRGVPSAWDDPVMRDGVWIISSTVAAQTGEVWIAWQQRVAETPAILVSRSTDAGATWSEPRQVSATPADRSAFNPAIAVTPDGRTVGVTWSDKRHGPDGLYWVDQYAAVSPDGGATWPGDFRLSDRTTDVRLAQSTPRGFMVGDYVGLVAGPSAERAFVAVWVDTRAHAADPVATRFAPRAAGGYDAWRVAHFPAAERQTELRTAAAADPDRDGLPNGLEYAYALDPLAADTGSAFSVTPSASLLIVGEPWYSGRQDATGVWEISTDGTRWSEAPIAPNVLTPTGYLPVVRPVGAPTVYLRRRLHLRGEVAFAGEVLVTGGDTRIINLATRGFVGQADERLIAGFVKAGGDLPVLLRAVGPGLVPYGVPDALADPVFSLARLGGEPEASADDWQASGVSAADFAAVAAFALPDASRDAALRAILTAPAYTAVVGAKAGATGVALVEVYAWPSAPGAGHLINVSTRGPVAAGGRALIGGFVLRGTTPRRVLVRAAGPALASLSSLRAHPDPRLEVFASGATTPLAVNDDWQLSPFAAGVRDAAQVAGAFAFAEGSRDAAVVATLPAGAYTVVVSGVGDEPGSGLVEIYALP